MEMCALSAAAPLSGHGMTYSNCEACPDAASDSPCSTTSDFSFLESEWESADAAGAALPHLFWMEAKGPSPSGYLRGTGGLTASVRASIIDWMCNTAFAMRLPREALHLGAALLDRFLAARTCSSSVPLGITACACLAIACKVEAASAPPLRTYLPFLSRDATLAALQQAEGEVLAGLDYRVSHIATTSAALAAILQQVQAQTAAPLDAQLLYLANYLADLSLLEYHLLQVRPSRLAAACLAYAIMLCGSCKVHGGITNQMVEKVVGCSQQQLAQPLAWLSAVHMTVNAAAANGCSYAISRWYPAGSWC